MRLTVIIHQDGAEYWSEISELPGCFASGRTLSELAEVLSEAVGLYLWDIPAEIGAAELPVGESVITARPAPSRAQGDSGGPHGAAGSRGDLPQR
jgi:predicted RNase H-like HicB family nuclease